MLAAAVSRNSTPPKLNVSHSYKRCAVQLLLYNATKLGHPVTERNHVSKALDQVLQQVQGAPRITVIPNFKPIWCSCMRVYGRVQQ
jgi:hypothetical protein